MKDPLEVTLVVDKSVEDELDSHQVATIKEDGGSSKPPKEESVGDKNAKIMDDLVKPLASTPLREAIKTHPFFSSLTMNVQDKAKALDDNVHLVTKKEHSKALPGDEKDALIMASTRLKNMGIDMDKGEDLSELYSKLEFAKAILANKEEVERMILDFESPKEKLKMLEKKGSPSMFSIPIFTINEASDGAKIESKGATPQARRKLRKRRKKKANSKKKVEETTKTTITPLTFVPTKLVDGKLECKVKAKHGSTPFYRVKILLDATSQANGGHMLSEKMTKLFNMEMVDYGPQHPCPPPLGN